MCGIVGMAGKITMLARDTVFKDMLDVCQVRGRDSTGVIKVVDSADAYTWVKQVGAPTYLTDSRIYEQRIEKGWPAALVGHCRAKTVGDVSVKNAHPFDVEDAGICGVHNGTLSNAYSLDTHAYGNVDSETLYGHLAKNGVQETFSKTKGAWACVWWDNNEQTLNFIRNDQRPLWFTYSKDEEMMFWASEPWMFGAVSRKIALWDGVEIKGNIEKFIELPINTLWSFKLNLKAKKDEKEHIFTLKTPLVVEPAKEEVRGYQGNSRGAAGGTTGNFNGDKPGAWRYTGNGNFSRGGSAGGEVSNPFLDDELPKELQPDPKGSTTKGDELTNSQIGNVHFLTNSLKPTGSKTDGKNSKSCTTDTASQTVVPFKDTASANKGKHLNDLSKFAKNSDAFQNLNPCKPTVRVVAGERYITFKEMGETLELNESRFFEQATEKCMYCDHEIKSVDEVVEVIDRFNFLCQHCTGEPKRMRMQGTLKASER